MLESRLLAHVYAANRGLAPRVLVPPGDDLAMIELGGRRLLAGVDQLVEGRHYDPRTTSDEQIGRKAVNRSLSDVAAMAGRPLAALVAITLPPDMGEARSCRLFDAMRAAAERHDCPLIGGDICFHDVRGHPLVTSVTVLAEPAGGRSITRGGAQVGDVVYVTGVLGGAHRGRHLDFEPRIEEAIVLADTLGERLHAMIDLSDGLGRDVGHIAECSQVAVEIDAARLPCSPQCSWRSAMGDGEDYELCFTASGVVPERLGSVPVHPVGRVLAESHDRGAPRVTVLANGQRHDATELGWQHES